jgi:glycosyltransferase involved in cell wall biosynthesis
LRILLVSGMYPSAERPEYGVFVERLANALRARGHEVDEAVLRSGRRGRIATPVVYAGLLARTLSAARRTKPDVVYAHYLVPPGLIALATGRPVVVTAHGGDVRNARSSRAIGLLTKIVVRRSRALVCVSEYVRERLGVPAEVIDCGVDIDRYRPTPRAPGDHGPRFLFVGSLTARKNVGRLMRAFARLREGSLTIIGAGPLEAELRAAAPAGVRFTGRRTPEGVLLALREHDVVCLPSLEEPQGQAMLEALACGRPVVATTIGGPPEIMTPACGALVDPYDEEAIAAGMRAAAALAVPCAAGVRVAEEHALSHQAERIEAVLARAAGIVRA